MKIRLDITKSVHENAAMHYNEAKRARKKIEGLEKAIAESEKELERALVAEKKNKEAVRVKKEKKWFEKFHWFYTSSTGKLAVGGKDAKQNDIVFARHMDDNDLFFHADIQGATALILKNGIEASEDELKEAAQFAASFSNAWKNANASVDVYAVRKDQLSKHAQGGFIPAGGFGIKGERIWFKKTQLGLKLGFGKDGEGVGEDTRPETLDKRLEMLPTCSKRKLDDEICLVPASSGKEKGELAKSLAKRFAVHPDELLQILPSGKSKTRV